MRGKRSVSSLKAEGRGQRPRWKSYTRNVLRDRTVLQLNCGGVLVSQVKYNRQNSQNCICIFLVVLRGLRDLSSLTRDRTQAQQWEPLDRQGITLYTLNGWVCIYYISIKILFKRNHNRVWLLKLLQWFPNTRRTKANVSVQQDSPHCLSDCSYSLCLTCFLQPHWPPHGFSDILACPHLRILCLIFPHPPNNWMAHTLTSF